MFRCHLILYLIQNSKIFDYRFTNQYAYSTQMFRLVSLPGTWKREPFYTHKFCLDSENIRWNWFIHRME